MFWLTFVRGLVARGLSGVKLVTSDSHQGLKREIAAVLQGASWQRCRTLLCATRWRWCQKARARRSRRRFAPCSSSPMRTALERPGAMWRMEGLEEFTSSPHLHHRTSWNDWDRTESVCPSFAISGMRDTHDDGPRFGVSAAPCMFQSIHVLADPAGHPFCIFVAAR